MADENKKFLEPVMQNGSFCFEDCMTADDCDQGLWCYDKRECVEGICCSEERCPDDGIYCNGVEYCDEKRGRCSSTPEPCAYCYAFGCTCDEETDTCMPPVDESERKSI